MGEGARELKDFQRSGDLKKRGTKGKGGRGTSLWIFKGNDLGGGGRTGGKLYLC